MNVIMKVKGGYLNINNGKIEICKNKKDATVVKLSEIQQQKEKIYQKKSMIGIITTEIIDR